MEKENIFARLRRGETVSPQQKDYFDLRTESFKTKEVLIQLNQSTDPDDVRNLLGKVIGQEIDESTAVFTPFQVNYGKNTRIGKNVFINFNCTLLDLGGITIDDGVLIAPNVSLLTEGHPIAPEKRHELNVAPIHIKENAWIGANAIVLKGLTIGKNSIVAAGSVVQRDVPDNCIVAGNPAKVVKQNIDNLW